MKFTAVRQIMLEDDQREDFAICNVKEFSAVITNFCNSVESQTNSLCQLEKELIDLEEKIFINQRFINELCSSWKIDLVRSKTIINFLLNESI